jgi:two-component system C4-dicarboxylate transport response regulator DctD
MQEVRERAFMLARQTDMHVLVVGEPGSGRRSVARFIHRASVRRNAMLANFDGNGLPSPLIHSELFGHLAQSFVGAYREKRGLVWRVHGGSLVVNEPDRLPVDVQATLEAFARTRQVVPLGARETIGSVDVRLFATTHAASPQRAGEGGFLPGLYNRLREQQVIVPPLRARGEDILELFHQFITATQGGGPMPRLTSEAEHLLITHRWPGNIPELLAVAVRLARHQGGLMTADDIAGELAVQHTREGSRRLPLH